MPDISYDTTTKRRFSLPSMHMGKLNGKGIGKGLLVVLATILTGLLAAVLAGVFMAVSSNVNVADLQITFDPQITIAYLLVSYLLSRLSNFTSKQMHLFFLLSLGLSYTTPFIQGSLLLVLLPPILRKLRLMTQVPASSI